MRKIDNAPANPLAYRLVLILGAALLVGALLVAGPAPRAAAVDAPTITGLSPNSGSTAGGNQVMVTGTNFVYLGTTITFGGINATILQYYGSTQILVLAPPHAAGVVNVVATTSNGPSTPGPASEYTYGSGGGGAILNFSSAAYSVAENGVSVTITVNRSGLTGGAVSVNYATSNGTAVAGVDYLATSGTLNFASGQTSATFEVTILDDALAETSETVNLTLSNPTDGASLGAQPSAVLTVTDNETGVGGSLQFSASGYTVAEGGGTATITVTRTGSTSGAVSVNYATSNGSATAGSDYTATSGTLSWLTGDSAAKTFNVSIAEDALNEGPETVNLTLSSPGGGAALGAQSTAVLTITDNETPAGGIIYFSSPTYSVNENGVSVTITVTRTAATAIAAGVNYATSNGTAIAASDYTATSGTLNWAASENGSKTFTVLITNDATVEGDETVNLTLSAVAGAVLGTQSTAVLTIVDNDAAIPSISLVSPSSGSLTGGEIITITGTNLAGATLVTFGGTSAGIISNTSTTITVFAPARGTPGTVDVQVTTPFGSSAITSVTKYTYGATITITSISPNSGPPSGGTTVTITGTGFTGATNVYFGTTAATSFNVVNSTTITAVSPAHSSGVVDVTVAVGLATSPDTAADNFTYLAAATTHTYALSFRWTVIVWLGAEGANIPTALQGIESPDNPATNNVYNLVTAIFRWDAANQVWLGFFVSGINVPGANDFNTFTRNAAYFVAVASATNWTILTP